MSIDIDNVPYEYRGCILLIQAIERQAVVDYLNGYPDAYDYLNGLDRYKGKLKPIERKISNKDIYHCSKEDKEEFVKNRLKEYYKYGIKYCVDHWGLTYNGVYGFLKKYSTKYSREELGIANS